MVSSARAPLPVLTASLATSRVDIIVGTDQDVASEEDAVACAHISEPGVIVVSVCVDVDCAVTRTPLDKDIIKFKKSKSVP